MKLWWINVLINEIIVGNVSICEIEEKINYGFFWGEVSAKRKKMNENVG
jgi:hypothetical protein